MYAKTIDRIRTAVAYGFIVNGVGLVLCINLFNPVSPVSTAEVVVDVLTCLFLVGVVICLMATLGLVVEYLVRLCLQRSDRKLPPYQFTLAGMLVLTMCVALVCACLKMFGATVIVVLVLAVVVAAVTAELLLPPQADREPAGPQQPDPPADSRPDGQ